MVLALALTALGLVLTDTPTSGKGPDPVRAEPYDGTFTVSLLWSSTVTAGDTYIWNTSRRPVTVSFGSANTHNMRVVGVYLTAEAPINPHGITLDVGFSHGLPTQDSGAVQGVKSWPQHKTLPATLLPGKTRWQIVWAYRVLSPKGGSVHGDTVEVHQGGHTWSIQDHHVGRYPTQEGGELRSSQPLLSGSLIVTER